MYVAMNRGVTTAKGRRLPTSLVPRLRSLRTRLRYRTAYCIIYELAECVALWGEPEQAEHGTIERRAASSNDMKGKRAII